MIRWSFAFILILTTNICLAQLKKIIVESSSKEKLIGVSILKISTANNIVSISDSLGHASLEVDDNETYLFHLLGYADRNLTGKELKKTDIIKLENSSFQLVEITIKPRRLKSISIKNKPGNWSYGESNKIKTVFDLVSLVNIKTVSYLKSFTIYGKQNMPGQVRIFKFLLFTEENGKPGKPILDKSIIGILKHGQITFDLKALDLKLEKEKYFIGYETTSTGSYNISEEKKNVIKGGRIHIETPIIFIKGNITNDPNTFRRVNLNNWETFKIKSASTGKQYQDFAYELKLEIEIEK